MKLAYLALNVGVWLAAAIVSIAGGLEPSTWHFAVLWGAVVLGCGGNYGHPLPAGLPLGRHFTAPIPTAR